MTKLIDPLGILATKPAAEKANGQTGSGTSASVQTARWEPSPTGKCPVCNNAMIRLQANTIDSYVCHDHRICLPVEDRT